MRAPRTLRELEPSLRRLSCRSCSIRRPRLRVMPLGRVRRRASDGGLGQRPAASPATRLVSRQPQGFDLATELRRALESRQPEGYAMRSFFVCLCRLYCSFLQFLQMLRLPNFACGSDGKSCQRTLDPQFRQTKKPPSSGWITGVGRQMVPNPCSWQWLERVMIWRFSKRLFHPSPSR